MTDSRTLACRCGAVRLAVRGAPILAAECHCTSCRTAAERLAARAGTADVRAPNGGVPYVLFRKDRIEFASGTEQLREFRLTPASKTRRVVAACCGTAVFTEFESGHWLSLFATLWPEDVRPQPEIRTMTGDRPAGAPLDDDVPNARRHTASFMLKLLGAWVAMGFRVPTVAVPGGRLEA